MFCVILTLFAVHRIREWEAEVYRTELEHHVGVHLSIIQKTIDNYVSIVESIAGLYKTHKDVDREDFRLFVRPLLQRYDGIQGLGWNPLLRDAERKAFEISARTQGLTAYHLKELNSDGIMVPAGQRSEYVPVYQLETSAGNKNAYGFDIASEATRREALEKARKTGTAVTTRWIRLVQEKEEQYGVLIVRPVFAIEARHVEDPQQHEQLLGYAVGVFRVGDIIESALKAVKPAGLDFWVYQDAHGHPPEIPYHHPSRTRLESEATPHFGEIHEPGQFNREAILKLPGRKWLIRFATAPAFHHSQNTHTAHIVLVSGLLLTGLLGYSLFSIYRKSLRAESLAADLAATNLDLRTEIEAREKTEQALVASERVYRTLIDNATEAITIVDAETLCLVEANRHAEELLNTSRDELLGHDLADLSPPRQPDGIPSREAARDYVRRAANGDTPVFEWTLKKTDGANIPCEIRLIRLPDSDRVLIRALIVDITERAAAQRALRESEEYHRALFEESAIGLSLCTMEGELIEVNKAFAMILGRNVEETIGLNFLDLTPEGYAERDHEQTAILEKGAVVGPYEKVFMRKDGQLVPVRVYVRVIEKGGVQYRWSSIEDISAYRQARARIEHMAFHDALTDLPNRELLVDRLHHAITVAKRTQTGIGVLFLDIDRFKNINDSLGHGAGDLLLKQVAERLTGDIREADTVARFGGDEFVVIAEQVVNELQPEALANKILKEMHKPFDINARELYVTASIGIAFCKAGAAGVETLIAQADAAMYFAKESGRNNYQVYSPEMAKRAVLKTNLESDLRGALHRHELTFHLQPIVSIDHHHPICLEALMRWESPTRGLVGPDKFISVMEDSGLIVPATRWMLQQTCRFYGESLAAFDDDLKLSVNLSAPCFYDADILEYVRQALDEANIEPSRLTIELTETALFHNPESVRPVLMELKSMGISVALDDFGTGQSSLSHLRNFPIDVVKIDREFVRDLPDDPNDCELVSAIIAMAHKLNMQVVAEGVENEAQLDFLCGLGCDSAQGYFFSPPLPTEKLLKYLGSDTPDKAVLL